MKLVEWSIDRPVAVHVRTAEQEQQLEELLYDTDLIAVDTETTGLNIQRDFVVFWSVSTGDNRFFLERDRLHRFKNVLEDPTKTWVGSQIKYDANMLANSGVHLQGDMYCTLTMDRLLNPAQPHGLKDAYYREFGEIMMPFGDTFYPANAKGHRKRPPKKTLYEIELEAFEREYDRVVDYASFDAYGVLRLFHRLAEKLQQIPDRTGNGTLFDLFMLYEVPTTRTLFEMERAGIQLDVNYLQQAKPRIQQRQTEIERSINQTAGYFVNLNSGPQLAKLLFEDLGLPVVKNTPGGTTSAPRPSTDADVLDVLAEEGNEVPRLIKEYRSLTKLVGTYIDGILSWVDDHGRVHTTFNQHVADTGRLSSSEPNLQNQLRSGTAALLDIRRAFVAPPGTVLIGADYDQLELYILAHFSNAKSLVEAAIAGKDLHTANAAKVYGYSYEELIEAKNAKNPTDHQKMLKGLRNPVKAIGFGLIYGKAARTLGIDLGYPAAVRAEYPNWSDQAVQDEATRMAQEKTEEFFAAIPEARDFIQWTHEFLSDHKYASSYLGNRRWFLEAMDWPVYQSHQAAVAQQGRRSKICWCNACKLTRDAQRAATNLWIQGTAADIVRLAMNRCRRDSRLRTLGVRMLLQVHDELVFEAPEESAAEACPIIQGHMEHPGITLRVPLRATPKVGHSWAETK